MTTRHRHPVPQRARILAVLLAALTILSLVAAVLLTAPTSANAQAVEPDVAIFDETLDGSFEDWSWATVDLASTDRASSGSTAILVDMAGWDALQLGAFLGVDIPAFGELRFDVHGGDNDGVAINVALLDTGFGAGPAQQVEVPGGQWTSVSISLTDLGSFSRIGGLWWQEGTGANPTPIWIDNVRIVAGEAPPPVDGPTLTVELGEASLVRTVTDSSSGVVTDVVTEFPHAISDGIYGMNFPSNTLREELDLPVSRWGGNSTERYNYETNSWNAGQDWVFGNVGGDALDTIDFFETESQADGTATIVTVPAIGWVSNGAEPSCSYPVADYGDQDFVASIGGIDCGDGYVGGQELDSVDPSSTSIEADETFASAMVQDLVARYGPASNGGIETYAIGNEPGLWHATHRDIRVEPIGRAEIIDRNTRWSQAIKAADPSAAVIGPVLWSGYSYFVTSEEILSGLSVTDVPNFSNDYLAAMASASNQAGIRLLDQFAVNYYDDRVFGGGTDEVRLASTRSLWDVTYEPTDWWVTRDWARQGVAAIPRLQGAINNNYPGTGLAITEYNFGGENSIAGALAQIDALGIFGREDLDTATIWDPFLTWVGLSEQQHADRPLMHAFRMYRNYDGAGSQFGDTALLASSTDEPTVSIYAAERSSDGALTILVNNKSLVGQNVALDVAVGGTAEVYEYSGENLSGIVRTDDIAVDGGAVLELPARSATLLVISDPTDPGSGDPVVGPPPVEPTPPPVPTPTPEPMPEPEPTPQPTPPTGTIETPMVDNGAVLIDPPASMQEGGPLDSADTSYIWLEAGPVLLDEATTINVFYPGSFTGRDSEDYVVGAGTRVCSFRVHADHVDDNGRLTGRAAWAEDDVIGLVYQVPNLRATRFLGAPDTQDRIAGLERGDRIEFYFEDRDDGRTYLVVDWDFRLGGGIDGMRILTDCTF